MKKLISLFLAMAIVMTFAAAAAEVPLTENEQNYVGSWVMYANNGTGKIYVIIITFLDNMDVVQRSMAFTKGVLTTDNKASGIWGGITDKAIVLTLAGTDMTAMIRDNGYLYLYFYKDKTLCGIYSKCQDMTSVLGW
ncbi:MAG: hypothetical protein J6S83_05470 [Lachnospiraceae bacterium]|nr:hypothetical protein [Lachnospiraceae bacterium]